MKSWALLFLAVFSSWAFAQSNSQEIFYANLISQAQKLTNEGKFDESDRTLFRVLEVHPENMGAWVLHGLNQAYQKKFSKLDVAVQAALAIDPTFYPAHVLDAYSELGTGNTNGAMAGLRAALQYGLGEIPLSAFKAEFEKLGEATGEPMAFDEGFKWLEQNKKNIPKAPSLEVVWKNVSGPARDGEALKSQATQYALDFEKAGRQDLALATYYLGSVALQKAGFPSEALECAQTGYVSLQTKGAGENYFQASRLLAHLMELNLKKFDFDNVLSYQADAIKIKQADSRLLSLIPAYHIQCEVFVAMSKARATRGTPEDNTARARDLAASALASAQQTKYKLGEAMALNALVRTHEDKATATKGLTFGLRGYELANSLNLDIKDQILSNMAICYYGLGTQDGRQNAYNLYRQQAEKNLAAGNWEAAANDITSLGNLLMLTDDYERAAILFEEVVKLEGYGPKYTNYRDRLTFYRKQVLAYQNLIKCYAHLGNAEKAFQAMEASRSRVLLERLGNQNYKAVSLGDLQSMLNPDEACILYSVTQGHEIIILTVTKKYKQVLAFEDPRFIGEINEKYRKKGNKIDTAKREDGNLNRFVISTVGAQVNVARDNFDKVAMAPKSDMDIAYSSLSRSIAQNSEVWNPMMKDLLYRFQRYLIVPILNRLSGVKNLIIAPDDIFNFVPFEALRSFDNKYLVEKYNIRYIHSASVLLALQQRQYADNRKPLLAMGGATYEVPDVQAPSKRTDADMNLIEAEVFENIRTGKSQRKAYAALRRIEWPFLQGSVEEVKSIAKAIPDSETFLGVDMTENKIKDISKSGQLKNYKVLHLATHGFVEESIPDLSGVVMGLSKQEQGGEDGFLNAPEIANLKLNADLTVLSACETARGQLFAGEGVTGITQSLIVAGSNAALVSLWKVDDVATMQFMTNFYKEMAKGKPYAQIVNDLKKKFIKGDFGKQFTHPVYWAPFVYYGK